VLVQDAAGHQVDKGIYDAVATRPCEVSERSDFGSQHLEKWGDIHHKIRF
jgi:hypothetical protein